LDGVDENWFRVFTRIGTASEANTTHAAGSGVITKTFPATTPVIPYPQPTRFVSFTFDDTPCSSTNELLDVLEQLGVRATFFVSGINLERARTNPDFRRAVNRIISDGHEILNHAWQHERWGADADPEIMMADFRRCQDLIYEFTGKNLPWIRKPYGSISNESLVLARELGLTTVRGVATDDWNLNNSVSFLLNRLLTQTGNNRYTDGQIYTWHDQPGQTNTIQTLPEIVHEFRSRGIGFKTLSELREHRDFGVSYPATPGEIYFRFFE
jgi:peptidoglycan/xylan/chitin deacetylase (PgdA/CDA1 family)